MWFSRHKYDLIYTAFTLAVFFAVLSLQLEDLTLSTIPREEKIKSLLVGLFTAFFIGKIIRRFELSQNKYSLPAFIGIALFMISCKNSFGFYYNYTVTFSFFFVWFIYLSQSLLNRKYENEGWTIIALGIASYCLVYNSWLGVIAVTISAVLFLKRHFKFKEKAALKTYLSVAIASAIAVIVIIIQIAIGNEEGSIPSMWFNDGIHWPIAFMNKFGLGVFTVIVLITFLILLLVKSYVRNLYQFQYRRAALIIPIAALLLQYGIFQQNDPLAFAIGQILAASFFLVFIIEGVNSSHQNWIKLIFTFFVIGLVIADLYC